MDSSVWLWLLTTISLASLCAALFALAALRAASRSILSPKNLNSVRTDFVALQSDYQRLFEMVSRLSKRQALADYKAGKRDDPAQDRPLTKAEAKRKYLAGKTHIEIARDAMKGGLQ
jgi:hypothetical protein